MMNCLPQASSQTSRANELFKSRYLNECTRVHRFMTWLMIGQWFVGIAFAVFYSPLTWIGQSYEVHVHVWAAIVLGGATSGLAILWTRLYPEAWHTRHVIAICQVCWSALLIHLSGGRIEAHFHVFGSLAILSIYRDWKILATATIFVAADHFVRGVYFPLSAFGVMTGSPYRWIEHAGWVVFEISFLIPASIRLKHEIHELCRRQIEIEESKKSVDLQVATRTQELVAANELLAASIREAEKLALVARFTDNAVIITDDHMNIEWVNSGFTRVSGYELDQALGKTFRILHGPATAQAKIDIADRGVEALAGFDLEIVLYRNDKEPFWASIEARPIYHAEDDVHRYLFVVRDISERVKADVERQKLNEQLVDASRSAGMAEVATGVLHNVGNILNSVNISASIIRQQFEQGALEKLKRAAGLITEHKNDFAEFVQNDQRGQKLPLYLIKVTDRLNHEHGEIAIELDDLVKNIDHIKEIVGVQQSMAKTSGLIQELATTTLIDDAITANKGTLSNHRVQIFQEIEPDLPTLNSDKHKILQVLINLIKNAKDALVEQECMSPKIFVRAQQVGDSLVLEVSDNGIGISKEKLTRIFQHGFTTKKAGHGFGLHSSANTATELGGSLSASSDGQGLGASFKLTLPINYVAPTSEMITS